MSVTCIDLFCGAGGLTHGLSLEGIRVKAGIDVDPTCRYPYEVNNDARFLERDISEISSSEILSLFDRGSIQVLAGCAPCQPFSSYRHGFDNKSDRKWGLLYEFKRIVEETRPDIVTMENVPRVRRHQVFHDFVKGLERQGYSVWADVVNCMGYGVPQSRNRMVLLASLHGLIKLIDPTQDERKYKTVRKAIGRLCPIEAGQSAPRDRLHVSSGLSPTNLARIKASKPGGTWRDWPQRLIADCHKVESGQTYRSVYGRMEWEKPAPTITTQCYGFGNGRFGHPEQNRAISLREATILQSFPRSYKFIPPDEPVNFDAVGRLIGNAVPVELGRAIAKSIMSHLSEHNLQPSAPSRCTKKHKPRGHRTGFMSGAKHKAESGKRGNGPIPSSEAASKRMAATGQRDTQPEMELRRQLYRMGLRYRVDHPVLNKPKRRADLVFVKARVAVFVDGCFWHGCRKHGSWPKSNAQFWREKIETNRLRDLDTNKRMESQGWIVIRIWEHEDPEKAALGVARVVRSRQSVMQYAKGRSNTQVMMEKGE